jgi:MFS family permease
MSAMGTALGPSLGGVLITAFGWRSIFLINGPVGIVTLLLAYRFLPVDRVLANVAPAGFDAVGTLLLAATLAAYALAMTTGHGTWGALPTALLLAALLGVACFVLTESRVKSPLIRLEMFRDPVFGASLAASALVSTVMMSTLVVGPFYLTHALGLPTALAGVCLSVGPVVVALSGVPAGRLTDRLGPQRIATIGLAAIAAGSLLLALLPHGSGIAGYLVPIVIITSGYALFQTSNNTLVMTSAGSGQRGVASAMLSLSRNLGLITGASLMGMVFALASGTSDISHARPEAITHGMRSTFAVAAVLMGIALSILAAGNERSTRNTRL